MASRPQVEVTFHTGQEGKAKTGVYFWERCQAFQIVSGVSYRLGVRFLLVSEYAAGLVRRQSAASVHNTRMFHASHDVGPKCDDAPRESTLSAQNMRRLHARGQFQAKIQGRSTQERDFGPKYEDAPRESSLFKIFWLEITCWPSFKLVSPVSY